MSFGYYEAAALLFGDRPFTTREFGGRTASPRPAKTLSEFKTRGLAERIGRGRYRLLSPSDRPDRRAEEWDRARRLLLHSGRPMAWSGPSAVEIWTGDRYFVSPSVFRREWYIDIPEDATSQWVDFLRANRLSTNRRSGLGNRVIPHPVNRLRRVTLHGEPVLPRSVVMDMIRSHRGIYANANRLVEHGP